MNSADQQMLGVINPSELYNLDTFKRRVGLSEAGFVPLAGQDFVFATSTSEGLC